MTRGRVGQDYERHKENEGRWRTREGESETKRNARGIDAEINRDRYRNQDRDRYGGGRRNARKENGRKGIEMGEEMCT